MNCPACSHPLSAHQINGITVDICRGGCGGIWFDNHELEKVDENFEPVDEVVLDVPREPSPVMDTSARRNCPHCHGMVMMRHWFTVLRQVEVDECPACGGVFMDHGELAAIRDQFDNEESRKDAARQHFAESFDAQLKDAAAISEDEVDRVRRFARMIKVLLPSWWIPGKQTWGAF